MENLIKLYKKGEINKLEFINKMHEFHKLLFDYRDILKNNVISKIEITDKEIFIVLRDSEIKMVVDELDKRTAPIEALNFFGYEKEETHLILTMIGESLCEDFTIFDIGANVGWYSLNIAKKFPDTKIHAFEPIPKTFDYLNYNIELNGLKNITTDNFGFSNANKDVSFYYHREGSGNSSLINLSEINGTEEIKSKVYKLDHYVQNNNIKVDFIKCDVEGAELFVFEGARETLKKYKPIVFSEMLRKWSSKFGYNPNDIIFLFNSYGYSCFALRNGKLSHFTQMDDNTVETNFIFLHSGKHANHIRRFC
jgi:FkbM family methyltransferase